jgi:hypothetical protein
MTGSATSGSNALGVLEQFFATSTSIGTSTSLSLNGGLFSFVQEGTAVPITAGAATSVEAIGTPGLGGLTFASSSYSYDQNVYIPAPVSHFTQLLGQLKNALTGLLSYLQTL